MTYSVHLDRSQKVRSGLCLGGMGTGGVELYPDGVFRGWQTFNNLPFGSGPRLPYADDSLLFFIVRWQRPGEPPYLKLLQIEDSLESAGIELQPYIFPWLNGVEAIDYQASFPFVRLAYQDADLPFKIDLEAFSPFIPADAKNSSLPVIFLSFNITSITAEPVEVTVYASMRSAAGYDVTGRTHHGEAGLEAGSSWLQMDAEDVPVDQPSFGWQALASLDSNSSYHLGWSHHHPYYENLLRGPHLPNQNWIGPEGDLNGKPNRQDKCFGTVAAYRELAAGESWQPAFLYGWSYPNLMSEAKENIPAEPVGYYHRNFFADARAVLDYARTERDRLAARTRAFHSAFFDSSLNPQVLDQVNSQLNTFVTSSWLTKDGVLVVQEGMAPNQYWGPQATIDVGLYGGVAALALFPELDRTTWRAHARLQKETGEISHGIPRNFQFFEPERPDSPTRIDLQAQFAILTLRNAFWSNDGDYLREVWPAVTRALDYALQNRDPDGDGIPDLAGVNSSYDNLAMYGAAAYMGSIWLSALDHAIQAARTLGDEAAAARYFAIRQKAEASFEARLWNGQYYRLYNDSGNPEPRRGAFAEIDEGCFTDQLIGQWSNHLTGLGALVNPQHIQAALQQIVQLGYRPGFGLRNCSWPEAPFVHDVPPDCWWDQANTLWSGTELGFASLLIYEGMIDDGINLLRTVDRRYRRMGLYFNHMEWGGHYYRAQSAWAVINAALGLSVCQGRYTFAPRLPGKRIKLLFAFAGGYGQYDEDRQGGSISFEIIEGTFTCREITLAQPGVNSVKAVWLDGAPVVCEVQRVENGLRLAFPNGFAATAGQKFVVVTGE